MNVLKYINKLHITNNMQLNWISKQKSSWILMVSCSRQSIILHKLCLSSNYIKCLTGYPAFGANNKRLRTHFLLTLLYKLHLIIQFEQCNLIQSEEICDTFLGYNQPVENHRYKESSWIQLSRVFQHASMHSSSNFNHTQPSKRRGEENISNFVNACWVFESELHN